MSTLLLKRDENNKPKDPTNIKNWREITLSVTLYKVYMVLIKNRLLPWMFETERLSSQQKGGSPRKGLQEHVFCFKTAIEDFKHESGKIHVIFFDIADAFGSLEHKIMLHEMEQSGIPQHYVEIIKDAYNGSTFKVRTSAGETKQINRERGIIQGCPWSIYGFLIGIDKWIRWLHEPHQNLNRPIAAQGYVDDVGTIATNMQGAQEIVQKTEDFTNYATMEVKAPKCAHLYERRSGNNWYKKETGEKTELKINGEVIKQLSREKAYPYLGHFLNLNGTWEEQIRLLDEIFSTRLEAINKAPLPISAKIEAINVMICSALESKFCNTNIPMQKLKWYEDEIVSRVRKWLGLSTNANRKFMFVTKNNGGLGLRNPTNMYIARKISFMVEMLNNDDDQVRYIARESFQLHMKKRKVMPAQPGTPSFGGYEVSTSGIIKKQSKQCLSKSQWVELNELCAREGIKLLKIEDEFAIVLPGTTQTLQSTNYYKAIYRHLSLKQLNEWTELEVQGAIIRQNSFDMQCSQEIFKNNSLPEKLVKFVTKARLQIAETNTFLHLCYPNAYQKRCPRCSNPSETISHVLNGCMEFKNFYVRRHNKILKLIEEQIAVHNPDSFEVYCDRVVKPEMLVSQNATQDSPSVVRVRHRRPDLLLVNKKSKKAFIVELSIPFDRFLQSCYEHKFAKYQELCNSCNDLGYHTRTIILIIGSLGFVHERFVNGLKVIGFKSSVAKGIARYASVSAQIGSYLCWVSRMR